MAAKAWAPEELLVLLLVLFPVLFPPVVLLVFFGAVIPDLTMAHELVSTCVQAPEVQVIRAPAPVALVALPEQLAPANTLAAPPVAEHVYSTDCDSTAVQLALWAAT